MYQLLNKYFGLRMSQRVKLRMDLVNRQFMPQSVICADIQVENKHELICV